MFTLRILALASVLMALASLASAYDVSERLSVGGVIAATIQCQSLAERAGADDECDHAVPIEPELSFRPSGVDEFFVKAGFANGNGLNDKSPFVLAPWVAYLHDDVKNINGSSRDYLLAAWYQHTFRLSTDSTLATTAGIIDATDYLDENAYANDEYTQFMNEALVNGPNSFLPSYDAGAALGLSGGPWSLRAVLMKVNENDAGNEFAFYGVQLGYTLRTAFGEGNYRVLVDRTSKDFLGKDGETGNKRAAILFSFDQQLGEVVGAFLRAGWQDDDAAVNYDAIWSGGINIKGSPWNRHQDNIGLGYAWLDGGNQDVRQSQAAEVYYRLVVNTHLALSADFQYMLDGLQDQQNPRGFIYGLRLTAEF